MKLERIGQVFAAVFLTVMAVAIDWALWEELCKQTSAPAEIGFALFMVLVTVIIFGFVAGFVVAAMKP
jgi:hypothetical protein